MSVRVEPDDFAPCFRCGIQCLKVAYWDDRAGGARDALVNSDFDYDFQQRDVRKRLVVHEPEKVEEANHAKKCINPEPPEEEEYKPFQGARSKS